MKKVIGNIFLYGVVPLILIGVFTGGWKTDSVPISVEKEVAEKKTSFFDFMKSGEERLSCTESIENINPGESDGSHSYKVVNIKSNTVKFPLNKDEVMMEYCLTVANLTSDFGGLRVTVQFLDESGNVLAETDERIADIPGMRTKTVYGSHFVSTTLADEVTKINVTSK